ncbi:hypothetical protein [Candidatus Harpocratesius sp.]
MSTTKIQKTLRWMIWGIAVALVINIAICWVVYEQVRHYFGFYQTISDLGAIYIYVFPRVGAYEIEFVNPSRWIFAIGFWMISLPILATSIMYFRHSSLKYYKTKAILLIFFFLGAIGIGLSWDYPNANINRFYAVAWLHMVGTLFFVLGFAIFNYVCQLARFFRKHRKKNGEESGEGSGHENEAKEESIIESNKELNNKNGSPDETPTESKQDSKSKSHNWDYYLDLVFVIIVFVLMVWYLISGLLGIINVEKIGWLSIFSTAISQKSLLSASVIAAFLLDKDDM